MKTHADKTHESKTQSVASGASSVQRMEEGSSWFIDKRPEAVLQRNLQILANNSSGVIQSQSIQTAAQNSLQMKQVAQLQAMADRHTSRQQPAALNKENKSSLPENLKTGIKNLSGYSMEDVKVHYNSDKPAQLNAHAYAQGTDIHLGSGQEKHLPHEAWHVVQQKQGRVKPTRQMKGRININDDDHLEKEADSMGLKAANFTPEFQPLSNSPNENTHSQIGTSRNTTVQRQVFQNKDGKYYSDMDPELIFDTHQDALDFESEMEAPPTISGGRPPTLYTHTSTKSTNKISSYGIPQGPHTMGHAAVKFALDSSDGNIDSRSVMEEQIRTPSQWRDAVNKELGGKNHFHGRNEFSRQLLRAYRHYNGLYQGLQRSFDDSSNGTPLEWMHELIQLDPYAVYGWANPKKIKKKHLKGKGENNDLSDIDRNIDTLANFKDRESYYLAIADRLELLDFDWNEESEPESDYESDPESDYESDPESDSTSEHNGDTDMAMEVETSLKSKRTGKALLKEIMATSALFRNNCLINAIAGGAGIVVSYEQLVEIRVRIGSIGNMLVASPNTVNIILNVLNINAGVLVHYHLDELQDNEPIGNQQGNVIDVYHTGHDHFVAECPDVDNYF